MGKQKELLIVVVHVDCKSGRELRHIPNTCHRVPNVATFLFQQYILLTFLLRVLPDVLLSRIWVQTVCMINFRHFHFVECFQKHTINVLHAVSFIPHTILSS